MGEGAEESRTPQGRGREGVGAEERRAVCRALRPRRQAGLKKRPGQQP